MTDATSGIQESGAGLSEELHKDPLLTGLNDGQGGYALGGVQLKAKLGEGGVGCVYLGWHSRLNVLVAVKVLKEASTGKVPQFLREARLCARLDHANLVRVLDVNVDFGSGLNYIVMEYVPGCDLDHLWRELSGTDQPASATTLDSSAWMQAVLSASRKQRQETLSLFSGRFAI